MSQAGNYPDCECCHYKMAYDEEAQSLDNGSGQNTPTNTVSPKLPILEECYQAIPFPTDESECAMFVAGISECHKFIVGRQLRASA